MGGEAPFFGADFGAIGAMYAPMAATYDVSIVRHQVGVMIGAPEVRGLDLTMSYRLPRHSFGRFRATWQSSYLLKYETKVPGSDGFVVTDLVGTVSGTPTHAFPRVKSNLALSWLYPGIELSFGVAAGEEPG